ncbi:uncharacterized protein LOC100214071 [Hydra vulgaris]|uniref:Multifunctional methyltransferase subunit TRM112-like protein n=1 Tax=Hydra vulgaris TaxID=6087 RepID=A0ABM4DEX3_HYDVU|nr:multifunctional methyltransferase subunit TRM112 homolog A [Hydra vulgaris]XP_047139920.1 multifunctional methyltransferase subunit TRM112 homolog A [Hydra vulgaris]
MKLLTHNLLTCNIKGVKNGFPLKIDATEVVVKESDFNPDFIARMIHKIEWKALVSAAQNLGHGKSLPEDISGREKELCENEEFLKDTHHVLMEIEIMEGNLICPETGRKFPISKGIPNMLLKEDEI